MKMIDFSLEGKTALITGGSRGIGRAIAIAFAEHGADIAIAARGAAALKAVQKEIISTGRRCVTVKTDLASDRQIAKLHETVISNLGSVDILVNNAGTGFPVELSHISRKQFFEVIRVNTWAALYLAQLCRSGMKDKGGGVILNISSTGAFKPDIFAGSYSASKSALVMLTKQIACEWAKDGIRCVAICPGLVRTDLSKALVEHREKHGHKNLVNRAGEAREVAGLALYLAGPAGSYCQGGAYLVDGGSMVNV